MKLLSNVLEREIDALPEKHRQQLHALRIEFEDEQRTRDFYSDVLSGPAWQALKSAFTEIGGGMSSRLAAYLKGSGPA